MTSLSCNVVQTLMADLRLGPDCSLTANAVVLVKQLSSLHEPSTRSVLRPNRAGNYTQQEQQRILIKVHPAR